MVRAAHLSGLVVVVAALLGGYGCSSTGGSASAGNLEISAPRAAVAIASKPADANDPGGIGTAAATGLGAQIDRSRDAYVLLSGGGTPLSNNYSQFIQAREIASFFARECPPERTWVFFGAGNREGMPPVLSDARHERKEDGFIVQSWVPGALPRNRPATRESFLRALRDEILPLVRDGGTLYLFVGDHGELSGPEGKTESAITLWQLKPGRRRARAWVTDDKEILGVAELRDALAAGLGQGRVVFGMTQCHSGGFHELGMHQEMMPPRTWFAGAPPSWWLPKGEGLRLRVAGFTATDQASPAAGCDADPDPERWAGYERFFPESLLGIDLMSGRPKATASGSFADAHEAATLVDSTIDKPRSTSEHYLEAWARLIETRLRNELRLTGATRGAVEAFERAVDRGQVSAMDDALRERAAQFERFTARLGSQLPKFQTLLEKGTRRQLESAIDGRGERGGRGGARGPRRTSMADLRKAWAETLRPAWKVAVEKGQVAGLAGPALAFEKQLIEIEERGRDLLLPRGGGGTAMLDEIYFASGHTEPATLNAEKADAIARWGAQRRSRIIAWAKESPREDVRTAAEKIGPGAAFIEEAARPLSQKTAAERVLFYRRVLAAWEFLLTMRAEKALAELHTLIELERLPVRPPSGA